MKPQHSRFAAHQFADINFASFSPKSYSLLKFGCDSAARAMGYDLAERFFDTHIEVLIANRCVVIPSPYNVVQNAATIMTKHFMDRLNDLLVSTQGHHVEYSIIHRKVSYTNDYGFLSKDARRGLIDNDDFYVNRGFTDGKVLIFIDDVRITGTHEDKLVDVMTDHGIENRSIFLYYAEYTGDGDPSVEAKLNFSAISSLDDYIELTETPDHHVIVRPIKYVLSRETDELRQAIHRFSDRLLNGIYHGCLGEGYYMLPTYQANFAVIRDERRQRGCGVPT